MDRWIGLRGAFTVKVYYKNGDSLIATRREFRRHYNLSSCSFMPRNQHLGQKFRGDGVGSQKEITTRSSTKSTNPSEHIEAVRTSFEKSPRRSVRKQAAAALNLRRTTVSRIHSAQHLSSRRQESE